MYVYDCFWGERWVACYSLYLMFSLVLITRYDAPRTPLTHLSPPPPPHPHIHTHIDVFFFVCVILHVASHGKLIADRAWTGACVVELPDNLVHLPGCFRL